MAAEKPNFLKSRLVSDVVVKGDLPGRMRNGDSPFKDFSDVHRPTRQGLKDLRIMGCAQYTEQQLINLKNQLADQGPIYIVDLRQEAHVFVDGIPISKNVHVNMVERWFTDDVSAAREQALLSDLQSQESITYEEIEKKDNSTIKETTTHTVKPMRIESPQQLVERHGMHYVRFYITNHHMPSNHVIDQLIQFLDTVPEHATIVFHCRGGKGRTTTAMVLVDIIENGDTVSLDDIIARQYLLGQTNLVNHGGRIPVPQTCANSHWKFISSTERYMFLKAFYAFRNSPKFGKETWSQWISTRL
ncbi:MAG: tyrosine-protein phosphatase [Alphaproteobacteria bacterium]